MALHRLRHDLYEADTLQDAWHALFRAMPRWLPWVSAGAFIATYTAYIRARLFISRWRRAARRRAERKYEALGHLHGGGCTPAEYFALAEDDADDEEEEEEDETVVTLSDIEEFRSSLGIRCPRDDDLLVMVEEMLLADEIPDGWVLYRTTAGIVRFLNLNTQELFFFHPGKRNEEKYILAELKRRQRVAMEAKFNFTETDEDASRRNNLSFASIKQQRKNIQRTNGREGYSDRRDGTTLSFSDDDDNDDDSRDDQSTFRRVFNYFVDRERKRIEKDVEKKYRQPSVGGTGGNICVPALGTPKAEGRSVRVLPINTVHSNSQAVSTKRTIS